MPEIQYDIYEQISKNIAELAEKNKINNYIFCALLDKSPSSISELFSNRNKWTIEHIISIAKFFGVSTDKIIFGQEHYIKNLKTDYLKQAKKDIKDYLVREKKYRTLGELEAENYFDELKT